MSATHIYRVLVRGFFDGLDDTQRAELREAQPDHDILRSAFTADGSLTYEPNVAAFSFRFEVRIADHDMAATADAAETAGAAARIGVERAERALRELGVGYKHLRATASDMADVWRDD